MLEIKTIESEMFEKMDDGFVKSVGMKSCQEVFDKLEQHLKNVKLLPDEYFSISFENRNQTIPYFNKAICSVDWGASEGIYIDISFLFTDNYQQKLFPFATGKTLLSSGDAFMMMNRIAAECSMMLNGRGDIVRVSENHYDISMEEMKINEVYAQIDELINEYNDVSSPNYTKALELVKEACRENFSELYAVLFENSNQELIFSPYQRNNLKIFYFNEDSLSGGQIVECTLYSNDIDQVNKGVSWGEVAAKNSQYLSDINTIYFFDTIFDLLQRKLDGQFMGTDVNEVCAKLSLNKTKDSSNIEALISNADRNKNTQINHPPIKDQESHEL